MSGMMGVGLPVGVCENYGPEKRSGAFLGRIKVLFLWPLLEEIVDVREKWLFVVCDFLLLLSGFPRMVPIVTSNLRDIATLNRPMV